MCGFVKLTAKGEEGSLQVRRTAEDRSAVLFKSQKTGRKKMLWRYVRQCGGRRMSV